VREREGEREKCVQVIEERETMSSYKQQSTIPVERERLRASEGERRGQGERES
jgi:hypothetical protein